MAVKFTACFITDLVFLVLIVVFIVAVFLVFIILGILEAYFHSKNVNSVPIRILVNGTRGKTTVSRQISSCLSMCNVKTLTKTTGSEALIIYPDGTEKPVERKRGFNLIREQRNFFKLASKLKVNAVVLECMAVRPESQSFMANKLVHPTVCVVTNAFVDHVDQMGWTNSSTAEVLRLSVPKGQKFYTSDSIFENDPYAIVINDSYKPACGTSQNDCAEFSSCNVHDSYNKSPYYNDINAKLSLAVFKSIDFNAVSSASIRDKIDGLKDEEILGYLSSYKPDIGLKGPFDVMGMTFVNGFAANDKESARLLLEKWASDDCIVIYNNRADREFRLFYFTSLFCNFHLKRILVIGDNKKKCVRYLSYKMSKASNQEGRKVIEVEAYDTSLGLRGLADKDCKTILGLGNIKGDAMVLLKECMENDKNAHDGAKIE